MRCTKGSETPGNMNVNLQDRGLLSTSLSVCSCVCVFYLFLCRLWFLQWTGCRTSQQCLLLYGSTSQSRWLFTPKNTSRRFRTSSPKQIKGQIHVIVFPVYAMSVHSGLQLCGKINKEVNFKSIYTVHISSTRLDPQSKVLKGATKQ